MNPNSTVPFNLLGVGIGALHHHMPKLLQTVELDPSSFYFLLCLLSLPSRIGNLTLLTSYLGALQGSLVGLESHVGALIFTIGGVPIFIYLILLAGTIFGRLCISFDKIGDGVLLHIANQAKIRLHLGLIVGADDLDV
jgi:hypothetical protein